jgi:alpha-tubulin suppressor-like RCC1 family protein
MRGRALIGVAAGLAVALLGSAAPVRGAAAAGGAVRSFGFGAYGQLGGGGTASSPVPLAVPIAAPVTAVAAGCFHGLALTAGGAVWSWGLDDDGQLGDGGHTGRALPAPVGGLPGGVTAIAAGCHHSLALTASGEVWAWGESAQGELGDGTTTLSTRPAPVHVSALDGLQITALAAGGQHSAALTRDGAVYAWGDNRSGQLGTGDTAQHATPVRLGGVPSIAALSLGPSQSLFVAADHSLLASGSNLHGELGDGTTSDRSAPVTVARDVRQAAAGDGFSLAVTGTATLLAWGRDDTGQLGSPPGAGRAIPAAVPGTGTVTTVAAGGRHALAVSSTGALLTWGDGGDGQLGDGATAVRGAPRALDALSTAVTAIAAGDGHTLVLTSAPGAVAGASASAPAAAIGVPNTAGPEVAAAVASAAAVLLVVLLRMRGARRSRTG